MKLTQERLQTMIREEIMAVLEDFELLMPLPLQAEPTYQELQEAKRGKIVMARDLVASMSDKERSVFWKLQNRFTFKEFLAVLSQIKTAEKGSK